MAKQLEFKYLSVSASLLEGIAETLMIHKLKVLGLSSTTLSNTNHIESAIGTAVNVSGLVNNWQSGNQVLRRACAGFMLAEDVCCRIGRREILGNKGV